MRGRVLPWIAGVAMLVAAWFVSGATPDGEQRLTDPFPVTATPGQTIEADNLGVTVRDVRFADRVTSGGWYAEGRWLVVELDAWLVHREPASLRVAYLRIGDRSFLSSERVRAYDPDAELGGWSLHVDVPQSGSIAFELPDDILDDADATRATLQLALGVPLASLSPAQNQHGAAVVELPLDLTSLHHETEIALPETEWMAR